jgi:hypothetical protein
MRGAPEQWRGRAARGAPGTPGAAGQSGPGTVASPPPPRPPSPAAPAAHVALTISIPESQAHNDCRMPWLLPLSAVCIAALFAPHARSALQHPAAGSAGSHCTSMPCSMAHGAASCVVTVPGAAARAVRRCVWPPPPGCAERRPLFWPPQHPPPPPPPAHALCVHSALPPTC